MKNNPEIEPSSITVHGVEISSREGLVWEIREMIDFLDDLEKKHGPAGVIEELFYDSKNSFCTITFREGFKDYESNPTHPILNIALKHLSQFTWDGVMKHGDPLDLQQQQDLGGE